MEPSVPGLLVNHKIIYGTVWKGLERFEIAMDRFVGVCLCFYVNGLTWFGTVVVLFSNHA